MARRTDLRSSARRDASGRRARPTVLVGLDGSATSWDAFWWARGEAERLEGRMIVAFVTPAGGRSVPLAACGLAAPLGDLPLIDACTDEQVAQLRSEVLRYAQDGCELEFVHAVGDAAKELLRIAERAQADVVVVGKSRKLHSHLAGSIGRRLIAKHYAPVVVVVP